MIKNPPSVDRKKDRCSELLKKKNRSDSWFLFSPAYIFSVTTVTAVIDCSVKSGACFVNRPSGFDSFYDNNDDTFDSGSHIIIDVTDVINVILRSTIPQFFLHHKGGPPRASFYKILTLGGAETDCLCHQDQIWKRLSNTSLFCLDYSAAVCYNSCKHYPAQNSPAEFV